MLCSARNGMIDIWTSSRARRRTAEITHAGRRAILPPDSGATFVEMLVSIVLLGTTVIAVLVALQASTVASTVDAEHARAYALLHEASDAVFTAERMSCLSGPASALIDHYDDTFTALTAPQGWEAVAPVITRIEYLNVSDTTGTTVYTWGPLCFEGPVDADGDGTVEPDEDFTDVPLKSQKITISVTSPDGSFTKLIETVKR
jgi:Tfp pilus assembly protein PilV